jgi:peptidoglycan hydrolase CwlO-like protein
MPDSDSESQRMARRRSDKSIVTISSVEGTVAILAAVATLLWFLISVANEPQDKEIEALKANQQGHEAQINSLNKNLAEIVGTLRVLEERTRPK